MKNVQKTPVEELAPGDRNLEESTFNFDHGYVDVAVRMLYYAVFHYEKALLSSRGTQTKSHKQTHVQFRRLFIRERLVDGRVNGLITELQEARAGADYGFSPEVSNEELAGYIEEVRQFRDRCRQLIQIDPAEP